MACPNLVLVGAFWIATGSTKLCLDESKAGRAQQVEDDRGAVVYEGPSSAIVIDCQPELRRVRARMLSTTNPTSTSSSLVAGLWSAWSAPFKCLRSGNPDLNGDGMVGVPDWPALLMAYIRSDPRLDLNGDGKVGFPDVGLWQQSYGGGMLR